ncbi:SDR family oxidoreductase [Actinoallomurus sp. CA-142502]|uniref:SDR family oxidoreductase n=1 Tax=Actinoallomurus sp. CA-142502 TaxID=3239885 RepID=UPI003D8BE325
MRSTRAPSRPCSANSVLAAEGARIALLERDGADLAAVAREIEQSVPSAEEPLALKCDVTDEAAVAEAVGAIDGRWGRIDALVSNAGLMLPTEKLRLLHADIRDVRRLTDTPGMRGTVEDGYAERVASAYPGGRVGRPEDIVPFVRFLCADESMHLSGTLLPIRPVTG